MIKQFSDYLKSTSTVKYIKDHDWLTGLVLMCLFATILICILTFTDGLIHLFNVDAKCLGMPIGITIAAWSSMIGFFIVGLSKPISAIVRYATYGTKDLDTDVFDGDFAACWFVTVGGFMYIPMVLFLLLPVFTVVWLPMTLLAILVFGGWATLWVSRKVFEVKTKLAQHEQNTNAHKGDNNNV